MNATNKGSTEGKELQKGFVEVDVNQHMGDSDAEMIAMIEGTLKEFINKQLSGQKEWMGS